ncbi:MAG: hypothetical protein P1V36_16515, partial [Planctomycetota bacterium]|nr:hypothetical protein [Planctomycetota bacterium]
MRAFLASLTLLAVVGLMTTGLAYAGDEAPAAKSAKMPVTPETPVTATKSPIHSMMKWVAGHVAPDAECGCPSTPAGEKAWRTWFAAKDGPLADLRTAMTKDGWNADRTIGFFKAMAAQKSCSDCDGCDKAKTDGAAAPTGDAGTSGSAKSACG